jgi:hypothetical protein
MDLARERLFHRCVLLRQAVLPGSIREVVWFLMGGERCGACARLVS